MEKDQILILIPCHNEINTLKKICLNIKKLHLKIIVVDDGSNDGTSYWLRKNSINFIKNKKKIGYEKSLIFGINYIIKKSKAKYLITFDADGEHQVKDLIKIINNLKKKDVDMIIGNRNKFNRWAEYILSFLFFIRFGIKDPLSGFKVYSIQKLKYLKNKIKNNSYLIDVILQFKKKKFILKNIPIKVNKRVDNPRVGNSLLINLKILSLTKFIFFN